MHSIDLDFRLSGYSVVELQGKQLQRFVNICYYRGIDIKDLDLDTNHATINVKSEHLDLMKELGERYHVKIFVKKRRGLPFYLKHYGKRRGFILGALLCYCFLLYMSNCVWEMEFLGNSYHTDSSLETYLKNYGITYGYRTNKIDTEEMELDIRKTYSDVAWSSVQIEGCKLIITITETNENSVSQNVILGPNEGIAIVAMHDALISGIVTQSGEPLVISGQYVKAGDTLVNGYITYKDDYDYVIGYKGVHAKAEIRAVWEIPFEISVSLLNTSEETCLTVYHSMGPINKIFPYLYYKEKIIFPVSEERRISNEQALIKLENKFYEQIKNWEENGYEVIEKNLKIEDNNREIYYVGTIRLEGPFGTEMPCTIPEISEESNEFNGN